ncbi:hypothetical protein ACOSP7_013408 [Xanthoceras sorbifolium]|uniref:Peroxidase n=1 Tax=Xanthoceras sorbifolium TaxID=99658 RepID=A0ABQ8HZD3_9ROSI|nr:hypothetical protein JRO89_XS06G0257900 [Xanthoceras sorbifolium]
MKSSISFLFVIFILHLIVSAVSGSSGYYGNGQNNNHVDEEETPKLDDDNAPTFPVEYLPADLDAYNGLSSSYYHTSCPEAEAIIFQKMEEWSKKDETILPSILRLFFHDSVVRGCDGSILLNHEGSERTAEASKTLRGFEVIDEIKKALEEKCPKTVSCADILTAAARDATHLLKGPYWLVPYGRKDGKFSVAKEADDLVPMGHEIISSLLELFQSMGLNVLDLVVLQGAHTVGRATCGRIQDRIYNYNGTGEADKSIDKQFLNYLTRKCRWASEYVDLDPITPNKFDAIYFKNILDKNMGLLATDQALTSSISTLKLVSAFVNSPALFDYQFGASMTKLSKVNVLTGDEGEVRTNCNFVNSNH